MAIPTQTAEIFELLSKGKFLCSNSTNDQERKLYSIVEDEQYFEDLYDYFRNINFTLEKGDEYFYFSRVESKTDLERKIEAAYKWIDILDFVKTFDNSFGPGFRFTPSDILVDIKVNAELETKLAGLKKHTGKETYPEIIDKILDILAKDVFIELENEISKTYKVLTSFKYLEQIILTIHIPDEVANEIPE